MSYNQAYWDEWAEREKNREDTYLKVTRKEAQELVDHACLTIHPPAIGFEVCVHGNDRYKMYLTNRCGAYYLWVYWVPQPEMEVKRYSFCRGGYDGDYN